MLKFIVIATLIAISNTAKLNVPKLLLPYHSAVATNFTLEVNKGCFTWRSTRPEIASVLPLSAESAGGCARQAVVTATSRIPAKKTAIVIAEDSVSGQQLRCDVIIDEIHRIEIETTTHELYLDDSPEEFIIRANNDEGDIFSTLGGLSFYWTLQPDTETKQNLAAAHNILRILSFAESSYKAETHIKALEESGKRGDRILVRGIRTGSARVSAKLEDQVYEAVKEAAERILVMANIQLNPPVVYLLQHTHVTYRVELIKQTQVQVIPMPSNQYFLEVDKKIIATLDRETSTATALDMGDTEVKLKDKHMSIPGIFREPSGAIYVVNPGYLEFTVLPDNNWVLQTGNTYIILIDIYDKESHKIFPSDNVRIVADFPHEFFNVLFSTENGTYHIVETLKRGFPIIDGILKAVILEDGTKHLYEPPIQGSQDAEIYDPVVVMPKEVILPWEPIRKTPAVYPLEVTGGSGNYTWTTSQSDVVTVNMRGIISTAALTGSSTIKAADARNAAHFDKMNAYVLPPGEMEFLPSRVEAEIGTMLDLPLAVYGRQDGKKLQFADCQQMPFNVVVRDDNIFTHIEESAPEVEGSCTSVRVKAHAMGHTVVSVLYQYMEIKLEATVTIAAYKPLKPIDPEDMTLVTPAASREIVFEGGPQPWVLQKTTYFEQASAEEKDLVTITPVRRFEAHKVLHAFRALCNKIGEQSLSLTVGNKPSAKNKFPAKVTAAVLFICTEPRGLKLIPVVKRPTGLPPCPISVEYDEPVPVYNYRDLQLMVTVLDKEGRRFDNFSSLALDWNLSDETLASYESQESLITDVVLGESGTKVFRSYRILAMKGKVGLLTVTVSVSKYDNSYFSTSYDLNLSDQLKSSRGLELVDEARINPAYLTLYNHQSNKPGLKVERGSGHFILDDGQTKLVDVKFDHKSRNVRVIPHEEGSVTVTAHDLCLEALKPARATIVISDVHQILLSVVDKVEIHKEIVAQVQVMDQQGQLIPVKYFSMMNLQPNTGSDIIALRPIADNNNEGETTAEYIVKGVSLGRTSLQFIASQKIGRVVSSAAREIQVFPPLKLAENITLIVGALFQVTAHGGPQPQSTIEFSIGNQSVASASGTGLVEALELGVTQVIGRAVGSDGDTGVVYSQDEVTVTVIPLEGIRIFAPLKRLQTGTEMPLYTVGINENETPFTFGSAVPPLKFQWSISNVEVAELKPLFHKSGMVPSAENNFAARLFAEEPGHVTVGLSVSVDPSSSLQTIDMTKMTDSVQIQVFERLKLIQPDVCDGILLMTPNTETRVKTNRDGSSSKLTYTVHDKNPIPGDAEPMVTVNEYGQLVSGARSGEASLLIMSHEDFGVNQSIVIHIKVRPVSYIMINVDTVIKTRGQHLTTVPVGTLIHFTISFHDTVGEKFYATNSKIAYRPNRFDLLQISHGSNNDTLAAKATNVGQTVLKVWDTTNPRMADYVNIEVGHAIHPSQSRILLGDIICFNSPLVSQDEHNGLWSSLGPSLDVDHETGIAVATHVGATVVQYNVSTSTVTNTEVSVGHIYKVDLVNDEISLLTNVAAKYKSNTVTVKLNDQWGEKRATVHGTNCSEILKEQNYQVFRMPFKCEVSLHKHHPHISVEDLVQASTEFDINSGNYQCRLSQSTSHDLLQAVASLDTSINVRAVVAERDSQIEIASPVLSLPFVPAFYIHNTEIQVSDVIPIVNLRITAIKGVQQSLRILSTDTNLIKVLEPETSAQQEHVVSYPISLQLSKSLWDRNILDASIEISSPQTGQEQVVPVRVKLVASKSDDVAAMPATWADLMLAVANNYYSIFVMLICVVLTLSCIFIAYQAILGQRYHAANTSSVFLQPGQSPHTPTSPWIATPPSHLNQSQSPSGRLWSVDYGPYDTSTLFKRSPGQYSPQQ